MEKNVLEMVESYLSGALIVEPQYESDHMRGYFGAIKNVKKHLDWLKEIYGLTPKQEERIVTE
jgi:hypothetical protein